ncbi:MAG: DUF4149 domain-containing protein [Nitrospirae bacterium]|nr:DUF4149 domain-containing protein [Nitrospirota bacterium]
MREYAYAAYIIVLALWFGGNAIFSFIVTPVIFRSFDREMAGSIVGHIFPPYFSLNLVLSGLSALLIITLNKTTARYSLFASAMLIAIALCINMLQSAIIHPQVKVLKMQMRSKDKNADLSSLKKRFGKLHGISVGLNLILILDVLALLIISRNLIV